MEDKRKEILVSSNLAVRVKPEFLGIFKSSQTISTIYGKSYFLAWDLKINNSQRKINELKKEKKDIKKLWL